LLQLNIFSEIWLFQKSDGGIISETSHFPINNAGSGPENDYQLD